MIPAAMIEPATTAGLNHQGGLRRLGIMRTSQTDGPLPVTSGERPSLEEPPT
jgi:hypothetical protein